MTFTSIRKERLILSSALQSVRSSLIAGLARLSVCLLLLLICLGLLTRVVCLLLLPYGWLVTYGIQKLRRGRIYKVYLYRVLWALASSASTH